MQVELGSSVCCCRFNDCTHNPIANTLLAVGLEHRHAAEVAIRQQTPSANGNIIHVGQPVDALSIEAIKVEIHGDILLFDKYRCANAPYLCFTVVPAGLFNLNR